MWYTILLDSPTTTRDLCTRVVYYTTSRRNGNDEASSAGVFTDVAACRLRLCYTIYTVIIMYTLD